MRLPLLPFATSLIVASTLLLATAAQAQLVISNITPETPLTSGSESYYTATLTNNGTSTISLDTISVDFSSPGNTYLTQDYAPFFDASFPAVTIDPGQFFQNVRLFGILSSALTPTSGYIGTVSISDAGGTYSATQDFPISNTAITTTTAEPASLLLALPGLLAACAFAVPARKKRSR